MRTSPSRITFVIAAILGSFSVYCVQSAVQGSNPTANADCGTPATPPAFTEIASGMAAASGGTTDPIDVSAYREVIVQVTSSSKSCNAGSLYPMFRQADDEVFAYTGQSIVDPQNVAFIPGGRVRVDGPQMQLRFTGCSLWRVVGVK